MKKILIFVLGICSLVSCGTTYKIVGDITLMDDDGVMIRKWDKATIQEDYAYGETIQSTFKEGGWLNFVTEDNVHNCIHGGIIIISNIRNADGTTVNMTNDEKLALLKEKYTDINTEINVLMNNVNDSKYTEEEKERIVNKIKSLRKDLLDIENKIEEIEFPNGNENS